MPSHVSNGLLSRPTLVPSAELQPLPVEVLLATTFDQLRTFSTVCRTVNIRNAARALGRDHSSVKKQLDTLEERFHDVANGRLLVHAASRGGSLHVTDAGRRVQAFADRTLAALEEAWQELNKSRRDRPLRFGVGGFRTYVGDFLAETHEAVAREFERRGLAFVREVVPTAASGGRPALLDRDDLDFAFATGMCRKDEHPSFDSALEFTEWSRDELVVLANIDVGERPLNIRQIVERRIPMVAPHGGPIFDLIVAELADGERDRLQIAEWCDDALVAIDLLHHKLRHAALFCTRTVACFAKSRDGSDHLRVVPYECDWMHSFGLLARRTDLAAWAPDHPARVLWELTAKLSRSRQPL
jgi:DNA-binding transcriptional LysR family regulator